MLLSDRENRVAGAVSEAGTRAFGFKPLTGALTSQRCILKYPEGDCADHP